MQNLHSARGAISRKILRSTSSLGELDLHQKQHPLSITLRNKYNNTRGFAIQYPFSKRQHCIICILRGGGKMKSTLLVSSGFADGKSQQSQL
mmetsp:Transcript_4732/g.8822  ORF Transcript_4732/g.8822 Transcript_4732/m.8822 type:complete len:92 (-) Transcript_4732:309-584(-)